MTTTTKKPVRRRTFKEVSGEAYAKGWSDGREQAREDMDHLLQTNADLGFTVLELEKKLANVSLRKLAWSRITGLFRRDRHD